MKREDAFEIIQKSRSIIVPSKWYEGFPMTIVESFSLGVPVIGSKIGNIESIIFDKIDGRLFEMNNKESLKDIIEDVFYNKEKNELLGENSYITFNKNYTDIENYKELIEIYIDLVGGKIVK